MRVAADHLFGDRLHHVAEGELALLLRHPGVVDHLQQKVAEFVAQVIQVATRDCVGNLIGLLDRVGSDGREILLDVPRTAGLGIAQGCHDLDQAGDVAGRLHRGMLAALVRLRYDGSELDHRLSTAAAGGFRAGRLPEDR